MAYWRPRFWRPYVPVWRRRAQAEKKMKALRKEGREVDPVRTAGRVIAATFWGKAWCENLERYSDFENRLPRGRTYVRNGSVIDLKVTPGKVEALVSGSSIYEVEIGFGRLAASRWAAIKRACSGKIDSVVELLQGKLSRAVMGILTAERTGLFPAPAEITMECSCPDWADMCKHVAAVLYGVGARLDRRPDLLFELRRVDLAELAGEAAAGAAKLGAGAGGGAELDAGEMSKLFGIEIEEEAAAPAPAPTSRRRRKRAGIAAEKPRNGRRPAAVSRAASSPVPIAGSLDGFLDRRLRRLRRHIQRAGSINNAAYRELFSVPRVTALQELRRLVAAGILAPRGARRGAHYVAGPGLHSGR